jgi:hypothetical protein
MSGGRRLYGARHLEATTFVQREWTLRISPYRHSPDATRSFERNNYPSKESHSTSKSNVLARGIDDRVRYGVSINVAQK